ncbi:Importin beta-3 [Entamoeba marina]
MTSNAFALQLFNTLLEGPTPKNLVAYKEAESQYTQLKANCSSFISLHVYALQNSDNHFLRKYAITQLNAHALRGDQSLFRLLPQSQQDELNKLLLLLANIETSPQVIPGYITCLTSIYIQMQQIKRPWNDVFEISFQWITQGDALHRERAIELLGDLLPYSSGGEYTMYFPKLLEILPYSLRSSEPGVSVNGVTLFKTVILEAKTNEQVLSTTQFFPLIIDAITKLISTSGAEIMQQNILESLQEIFEEVENGIQSFIPMTLQLCYQICMTEKLDFTVHATAFEVILTIAEIHHKIVKRQTDAQIIFFQVIVRYLTTVDDSEKWYKKEECSDDLPYYYLAIEGISRFVESVGGSVILQHILGIATQFVSSVKWQDRHTLVNIVNTLVTNCKVTTSKHIDQLMKIIVPLSRDSHPRVRYLVIVFCNKVLSSFSSSANTENFLPTFLTVIDAGLSDDIPRIQSRTCDFLSNLVDLYHTSLTKDKFPFMLQKIQPLLSSSDINVIAESLCSLSYVVIKMKADFEPYYLTFSPLLEKILTRTGDDEKYFEIKGRVIECLSIIGMDLKGDYCSQCAQIIINEVDRILTIPNLSFDNSIFGFVETSCTRLAEILQEKFKPYLPTVLRIILQRTTLNVLSDDSDEDKCEQRIVGKQLVNVHTARSEEKKNAIGAIADFANDLGMIFLPYVADAFQYVEPLINDPYDENIRDAAAKCSFRLLKCFYDGKVKELQSEDAARQQVHNSYLVIVKDLCNALAVERFVETIVAHLLSLYQCIELLGVNSLPPQYLQLIFGVLTSIYVDYVKRIQKEKENIEEDEEEDILRNEENDQIEQTLILNYRLLLASICKNHQQTFYSFFEQILFPPILETLNAQGICNHAITVSHILLTIVCYEGSQPSLVTKLVPLVLQQFQSTEFFVIFTSFTNLYLLIEFQETKPFIPQIYQQIQQFVPLKETHIELYETAMVCLGRCLAYYPELFPKDLPLNWLSILPLKDHVEEVLSSLFLLLRKNIIEVIPMVIKKVIVILVFVFDLDDYSIITPDTKHLIATQFNQWRQTHSQVLSDVWEQLRERDQSILNGLLTD